MHMNKVLVILVPRDPTVFFLIVESFYDPTADQKIVGSGNEDGPQCTMGKCEPVPHDQIKPKRNGN